MSWHSEKKTVYLLYIALCGPYRGVFVWRRNTFRQGESLGETVKNVFFYFYVEDNRIGTCDIHDCIEVYVQKRDPEAARKVDAENAAKKALWDFEGNTFGKNEKRIANRYLWSNSFVS